MNILYLINESFPFGKAYSSRARAIVECLTLRENKVFLLCDNYNSFYSNSNCLCFELKPKKGFIYRAFIRKQEYIQMIDQIMANYKIDIVISRNMFDILPSLIKCIRKHHKPLIVEVCEKYNKRTFKRYPVNIRYYQFLYSWNVLQKKADGILSISRYLTNYFSKKGLKTMRLPGILVSNSIDSNICKKIDSVDGIHLIYSGDITGGKERFDEIFRTMSIFDGRFKLDIFGPNRQRVVKSLSKEGKKAYKKIEDFVFFRGMVSQQVLHRSLINYNFGIFIRPLRESSNAGFPTKLGEYLSSGMPVISNDTGDISLILKDGKNGFVVSNDNVFASLCNVFTRINALDSKQYLEMQKASLESAKELLDFKAYSTDLTSFLKSFGDN